MTLVEREAILTPLRAALEYGIAANFATDAFERKRLERLMLNRLEYAVENAGIGEPRRSLAA